MTETSAAAWPTTTSPEPVPTLVAPHALPSRTDPEPDFNRQAPVTTSSATSPEPDVTRASPAIVVSVTSPEPELDIAGAVLAGGDEVGVLELGAEAGTSGITIRRRSLGLRRSSRPRGTLTTISSPRCSTIVRSTASRDSSSSPIGCRSTVVVAVSEASSVTSPAPNSRRRRIGPVVSKWRMAAPWACVTWMTVRVRRGERRAGSAGPTLDPATVAHRATGWGRRPVGGRPRRRPHGVDDPALSDCPAAFAACSAVAFNRSDRRTVRRAVGSSLSSGGSAASRSPV